MPTKKGEIVVHRGSQGWPMPSVLRTIWFLVDIKLKRLSSIRLYQCFEKSSNLVSISCTNLDVSFGEVYEVIISFQVLAWPV